jgi:hypothetical protein
MSRNVTKAQPAGYAAFHETAHMDAGTAVAHDLTLDRVVLGGILCNGFRPLEDSGLDLRPEDFANPDHGKTLAWLRENRERWQHGYSNLVDIHAQLDKAGLAARLGQGSAGVSDLMEAGREIGFEVLKHRTRELIDASIERHRRKLASDYAERRLDYSEYSARLAELAKREDEEIGGLPPFLSLEELDAAYPDDPPLLIAGSDPEDERDGAVLALGEVGVLGSASKLGKTWSVIDAALAVATGRSWMSHFVCKPGRVLYVNMELGGRAFVRRTEMLLAKRGIKASEVMPRIRVLHLRNTRIAAVEELGDLIAMRGERFDLVILDPLYKLLGSREENSNGDMGELMQAIRERFCNGDKTAVMLVHHFPKGDMTKRNTLDKFAGAGAIARDADTLITITPEGETFRLEYTTRDYKAGNPLELKMDFPVVDVAGPAEVFTAKAKAAANHALLRGLVSENTSMTKADLVAKFMVETGLSKSMAYKAITAAEKAKAIERTKLEKTYVAL